MATAKKAATGTTKNAAPKAAEKPKAQGKKSSAPVAKQPAAKVVTVPVKATKTPAPAKAKEAVAPVAKAAVVKTPAAKKAPVSATKDKAPATKEKVAEVKAVEKKVPKEKNEMAKEIKVKVPKTTVKTSVPYQPTYQALEDRAEENNISAAAEGPLVRYSDADLSEFKDIINKKLGDAKRELTYLQGLITRKDHLGGEADSRYMTMEDGTVSMEREQLSQMASRQISYIDHLEKALIRIENKTYGICRVTGKLIEKARLKAVPHATLSLEAKMGMKK